MSVRDALRLLDLFTTSHLKKKYEDEFAELDGHLEVAKLMAQCTIFKAKFAECLWFSRMRAAVEALGTRAKVIEESKSTVSALGFSEPVSVALGRWMAQLTE